MLRRSIHDKNTSINENDFKMNQKTLLSSFLPPVLEEYEEKRNPGGGFNSHRNDRRPILHQQPQPQPLSPHVSASSCSLIEKRIGENDKVCHRQVKPGKISLVSDNAKIPTTRLRERSGSLQFSDNGKDDKRQSSSSSFDYDHSSTSLMDYSRDLAESDDDIEECLYTSILTDSQRRDSFRRWSPKLVVGNKNDKPLDHRWSAHGSFSSIPSVDHTPKKYTRRPST